ncbi:MAG TPA: amidase [Steroidobacteraceae bacterium]|nr:amidase [Steroidobacteraceae bacterium]
MTALHYLELTQLASCLRTRELSPVEVTRAQLARIAALDGSLASYARVIPEEALAQAERAESEIAAGHYRGALHGVPIGIKDLCWVKGVVSAAGMAIHRDFRPAEDATVVARLAHAGAVILGKLEMTEGAYSDHHPSVTPPKNPWNTAYWPGISSSGPAVATAAGLCYGAVASDTGGSIRWPCGANGLTGLKPTWGRVSRFGVFELAASLDHVGPIARSAADAGALLRVMAGSDEKDPTSSLEPVPDYLGVIRQDLHGLRVGIDRQWNSEDVDPSVQAVVRHAEALLRDLGADLVETVVPDVDQAIMDWAEACAVEAAVAHEATYPACKEQYGAVLRSVLDRGSGLRGLQHQKIWVRRRDLRGRLARLFQTIDLLLAPVHPFAPLTLAEIRTLGEQAALVQKLQRYTAPFNMTGSPTITLPGGFNEAGLPIGFQLIARDHDEGNLVRAGVAYQRVTDWHRRHPIE